MKTKTQPEIFVSIDIETDGPAPGINSMIGLGAVAFDPAGNELAGWYSSIEPAEGSRPNDATMKWWREPAQAEAWNILQEGQVPAHHATIHFKNWLEHELGSHNLIAVGWPIAFDFAFINFYMWRYCGRNPLGFSGLDIRSYANGLVNQPSYNGLPERMIWSLAGPLELSGLRPHYALDDATAQGRLFMGLRRVAAYWSSVADNQPHYELINQPDSVPEAARDRILTELAHMPAKDRERLMRIYQTPRKGE